MSEDKPSTETLKTVIVGASIELRKLELLYEKDPTINGHGHHNDRVSTIIRMRDKIIDEVIKREENVKRNDKSIQDSRD